MRFAEELLPLLHNDDWVECIARHADDINEMVIECLVKDITWENAA